MRVLISRKEGGGKNIGHGCQRATELMKELKSNMHGVLGIRDHFWTSFTDESKALFKCVFHIFFEIEKESYSRRQKTVPLRRSQVIVE